MFCTLFCLSGNADKKHFGLSFTLAKVLEFVESSFEKAVQESGHALSDVAVSFRPHYLLMEHLEKGGLFWGGRPKGTYCHRVAYKCPIMIFFNKKTLGKEHLDLTKEDLKALIEGYIRQVPSTLSVAPTPKLWQITTGAVSGHTKRALALFTDLPYKRLKQTGEPTFNAEDPKFIRDHLNTKGYDFVMVPLPLNEVFFYTNLDDKIGIASVNGKMPTDPQYPLFDIPGRVCGDTASKETIIAGANILQNPSLKAQFKQIGLYPIAPSEIATLSKLEEARPDLFLPLE